MLHQGFIQAKADTGLPGLGASNLGAQINQNLDLQYTYTRFIKIKYLTFKLILNFYYIPAETFISVNKWRQ